jgi:hypothetical protein
MGSCLTKEPYILQIENKKLTRKELYAVKSYKDALKIAGINIENDTTIQLYFKNYKSIVYANGNEPFQLVEMIRYEGKSVYIQKLYGK